MGKGVSHGPGVHVSIRQLAEETGFDRDTVSRRLKSSNVQPSGKRGGHGVYRLRDALPAMYVNGEDGKIDPSQLEPFQRKAHWQAEREADELRTARRELIPRIEVEEEQSRVAKIVVQALETLPDILERDCGLRAEQVARVEAVIDQTREAIYERVVDHEGDASQAGAPPAALDEDSDQ